MSGPALVALMVVLVGCERPGVSSGQVSLNTSVGTVVAECIDNEYAKIDSASPFGGYSAKVVVAGPSSEASVSFENPAAMDIRVAVRCVDGALRVEEFDDEDVEIPPENG